MVGPTTFSLGPSPPLKVCSAIKPTRSYPITILRGSRVYVEKGWVQLSERIDGGIVDTSPSALGWIGYFTGDGNTAFFLSMLRLLITRLISLPLNLLLRLAKLSLIGLALIPYWFLVKSHLRPYYLGEQESFMVYQTKKSSRAWCFACNFLSKIF